VPKQIDWEEIRKYWQTTGASSQAIADHFGVSKRAVDDRLPQWRSTEKSPKVVTLQARSESRQPTTHPPIRRRIPKGQIDKLEILEDAIAQLSATLSGDVDPRSMGSIAGGLIKLMEYHDKKQPLTAAEVVDLAIEVGVTPQQFVDELKAAWQQRA
jgi:hypothetical protein